MKESNVLPKCYGETYKKMLQHLACEFSSNRKDKPCTAFWPMKGKLYKEQEGLMVIGRAVNGWSVRGRSESCEGKGWYAKDLKNKSEVEDLIHGVRCLSESLLYEGWKNSAEKVNIRPKLEIKESHYDCPLSWVVEKAGSKNGGYNTNRSAFWRVNKTILQNLFDETYSKHPWSSHLCWSNLYKIAPLETGNPLKSSINIQQSYSIKLLEMELRAYNPKYVLVLTGKDWYKPFADCLDIEIKNVGKGKPVEEIGLRNGQTWVFAKHPQGRSQGCFVSEVNEAFEKLKTS